MNRTSRTVIGMETPHVWGNPMATHDPSDFHKPDAQVPTTIKGFVSNGFKSGGTYKQSMECHHQPSQIWGCPTLRQSRMCHGQCIQCIMFFQFPRRLHWNHGAPCHWLAWKTIRVQLNWLLTMAVKSPNFCYPTQLVVISPPTIVIPLSWWVFITAIGHHRWWYHVIFPLNPIQLLAYWNFLQWSLTVINYQLLTHYGCLYDVCWLFQNSVLDNS